MNDRVFHALADPHRRVLLDRLRQHGDQSLTQLCHRMPMTRQAVSKHLAVLGGAGLVRVRRSGRERLHSLDPEPLRSISGWLTAYTALWDDRLADLQNYLEENP